MKPLEKLIKNMGEWPEEARRLLAGTLFLISIVLVFVLWRQGVTGDLSSISQIQQQVSEKRYDETPEPPRPLAGIVETLGAIKNLLK